MLILKSDCDQEKDWSNYLKATLTRLTSLGQPSDYFQVNAYYAAAGTTQHFSET